MGKKFPGQRGTAAWVNAAVGLLLGVATLIPANLAVAADNGAGSNTVSGQTSAQTSTQTSTGTGAQTVAAQTSQSSEATISQDLRKTLKETREYLLRQITQKTEGKSVFGTVSEWQMFALARDVQDSVAAGAGTGTSSSTDTSGAATAKLYEQYYDDVVAQLKANDGALTNATKATDYDRIIIALTAMGYDAQNIGGFNLFDHLTDLENITRQGPNGPTFALIAWELRPEYQFVAPSSSTGDSATSQPVTVEALVDSLLSLRKANNSWNSDPDYTAMALEALAPLKETKYDTGNKITDAIEKAVDYLSSIQLNDGGFASWGAENSNSSAQVVTALSALGISSTDSRFVKGEGTSAIEMLLSYSVDGGGFCYRPVDAGTVNAMATEQDFYALVAYDRYLSGASSLYDMSDVTFKNDESSADDSQNQGDGSSSGEESGTNSEENTGDSGNSDATGNTANSDGSTTTGDSTTTGTSENTGSKGSSSTSTKTENTHKTTASRGNSKSATKTKSSSELVRDNALNTFRKQIKQVSSPAAGVLSDAVASRVMGGAGMTRISGATRIKAAGTSEAAGVVGKEKNGKNKSAKDWKFSAKEYDSDENAQNSPATNDANSADAAAESDPARMTTEAEGSRRAAIIAAVIATIVLVIVVAGIATAKIRKGGVRR
ncbi:MAG: terpene cyclase/mutase family protein [Bifidobacteriaceae bacterium]|nr:terpene cyclase/mutase family protein [Bifidobacteriaceae bacterium]MCI1978512.1 terpene cyclase/mutase family protein [Bifidobacteriaceae bacterium]